MYVLTPLPRAYYTVDGPRKTREGAGVHRVHVRYTWMYAKRFIIGIAV